jgi:hypothetical protein
MNGTKKLYNIAARTVRTSETRISPVPILELAQSLTPFRNVSLVSENGAFSQNLHQNDFSKLYFNVSYH